MRGLWLLATSGLTVGLLLGQGKLHPEVGVFELCSLK